MRLKLNMRKFLHVVVLLVSSRKAVSLSGERFDEQMFCVVYLIFI